MHVKDQVGVLADVAKCFANRGISLKTVRQEGSENGARLVVVTHMAREDDLEKTVADVSSIDTVLSVERVLRMEGED